MIPRRPDAGTLTKEQTMTRKDYVAIAAAIKDTPNNCGTETMRYRIAFAIADVMARDNPRFDRARFLAAAGVQS